MHVRSLLRLDARLSDAVRLAEKPGIPRTLAVFFATSGDSWFWGAALVLLWALGNGYWKHWAVIVLASISALAVLVMSLKFLIRRRRPVGDWGSIYRNTDPHSFPSGHAARAFLIAVLAAGLGSGWLAWVLWVWAPLVSVARVAMGVHYLSDIAAGMITGIIIGIVILQIQAPVLVSLMSFLQLSLW